MDYTALKAVGQSLKSHGKILLEWLVRPDVRVFEFYVSLHTCYVVAKCNRVLENAAEN